MFGELVSCCTEDGVRLDGLLVEGGKQSSECWLVTHGVNDCFYGSPLLKTLAEILTERSGSVLLVNNRGHDISAFNFGAVPMRLGSQYESIHKCVLDLNAWGNFILERDKHWTGVAAHSLGAIKTAYWALDNQSNGALTQGVFGVGTAFASRFKVILLSPPRLTTSVLLTDPKRGQAFSDDLEHARTLCDSGRHDHVMRIRYPMPNWVSAATFLDKYGSADRYDYIRFLEQLDHSQASQVDALWLFGEREVRQGSANFLDADLNVLEAADRLGQHQHHVSVVSNADHSYRGCEEELKAIIHDWLDCFGPA